MQERGERDFPRRPGTLREPVDLDRSQRLRSTGARAQKLPRRKFCARRAARTRGYPQPPPIFFFAPPAAAFLPDLSRLGW